MPDMLECPAEIPQGLNDHVVRELAALRNTSLPFVASTIALFGFGARMVLEEYGAIELQGNWPQRIVITDKGERLIETCARWVDSADEGDWDRCRRPREDTAVVR